MDSAVLFCQLLRMPASFRTALLPHARPHGRTFALLALSRPHARFLSLPRIVQPSFWASMVPRPIKGHSGQPKVREWNPATPYIILGLLVGSQAIQTLWLKQERAHSLRKAEAKIGVLREVIERVQRGEDVSVEKVLGTGDAASEREWAEVLKDIEDEEVLFQSKKRRKALRQAAAEAENKRQTDITSNVTNCEPAKLQVENLGGAKFY
ncbi:hypothetical protein N0V83_002597 [Neocucurbitaria cava]|uniref:Uncharacterized protein n=1 Tax=Neocucurbitaria cava TaxID=798079 RepID=A0A9W8YCZ4_9PLEO|nr:hypothetical protein N0V83_002597 [Neocucurbitaria cava]